MINGRTMTRGLYRLGSISYSMMIDSFHPVVQRNHQFSIYSFHIVYNIRSTNRSRSYSSCTICANITPKSVKKIFSSAPDATHIQSTHARTHTFTKILCKALASLAHYLYLYRKAGCLLLLLQARLDGPLLARARLAAHSRSRR